MIKFFSKDILIAIFLFVFLLIAGTVAFHYSQNYPWIDALYMTVITVTTVGFGEIHPLNSFGKILTIILIISSIVIYAYTISVITEFIVGENFFKKMIKKRMKNKIKMLQQHIVIIGYGRTGKQALKKLKNHNKKVVIIDTKMPENDRLIDFKNIFFLEGDATQDDILQNVAINKAHSLITTLPSDADNLFIVLSSRQMNKELKIITRASKEKTIKKMKLAGANHVILPEVIGGDFMASLAITPDLIEFLNLLSVDDIRHRTNLEEIHFNNLPKEYQGKSIANLDLRRKSGCTIIGYKAPDNKYIINPSADTIIEKNSSIIVLGQPEQIEKLNKLFKLI